MTKEEKIKEAYGEYLDRINPSLLDGWSTTCFSKNIDKDIFNEEDTGYFGYLKLRPKSLQGIENNNGWIKIESYIDIANTNCFVYTNKGTNCLYDTYMKFSSICELEEVTHYQPIQKPQPPIY